MEIIYTLNGLVMSKNGEVSLHFPTQEMATAEFPKYLAIGLENNKTEKIKQLHDNYSEFYKTYTESYSTLEVESFKDKADEAKAYMRDNTASTPYVDAMVGGDPLARVEILNAIWAKVAYLASVEGQVVTKRDAIKLATTQTQLDLIDVAF